MIIFLTVRDDVFPQIGSACLRYNRVDGEGRPAFRAEGAASSGYTDITSLKNWARYGWATGLSDVDLRDVIVRDFSPRWTELTDEQREFMLIKANVGASGSHDIFKNH